MTAKLGPTALSAIDFENVDPVVCQAIAAGIVLLLAKVTNFPQCFDFEEEGLMRVRYFGRMMAAMEDENEEAAREMWHVIQHTANAAELPVHRAAGGYEAFMKVMLSIEKALWPEQAEEAEEAFQEWLADREPQKAES